MAKLLLGLLLTTTPLTAAAEDPCALARRIAQSPPCLAGSACEALDLWREAFGRPDVVPAGSGQLPPELLARLPDSEVNLGKVESYEAAFRRLGEVSGVEVLLHPDIKEKKVAAQLGPMPVGEAWTDLLSRGFLTHFDGERLLIAQMPPGPLRRLSRSMTTCPVR